MIDIKWIRENPEEFDSAMSKRGLEPISKEIISIDDKCKNLITKIQSLQTERNFLSKEIGVLKSKNLDANKEMEKVSSIKNMLEELENAKNNFLNKRNNILVNIPNIPDKNIPEGINPGYKIIKTVGKIKKFKFKPKEHYVLGENLGFMDFDIAAKISGSRFVILKDTLAKLERALVNLMLSVHTKDFDYLELSLPSLVNYESMYGTGQLPKFESDLFKTTDGKWLIPTAEVPLTNIVSNNITDSSSLPIRLTAHTNCYRSEAGSAGKDTRGMIRLHEFSKVELVSICHPEDSKEELERMTNCAENILNLLEIPYRVICLSSADLGFSANKTYDIEVWLPGQNSYREISSCSNCKDFQARRMNARFRLPDNSLEFVHTLNGSALAVGRTIIAILENYQLEDGSIVIPNVLRDYMGGMKLIKSEKH